VAFAKKDEYNFVLRTFGESGRKMRISKFSTVVISATGKRHDFKAVPFIKTFGRTSL